MSEKKSFALEAHGEEIDLTGIPIVNRDMTTAELFLGSVFTIWVAGHEGDKRALDIVDQIMERATEILQDEPSKDKELPQ